MRGGRKASFFLSSYHRHRSPRLRHSYSARKFPAETKRTQTRTLVPPLLRAEISHALPALPRKLASRVLTPSSHVNARNFRTAHPAFGTRRCPFYARNFRTTYLACLAPATSRNSRTSLPQFPRKPPYYARLFRAFIASFGGYAGTRVLPAHAKRGRSSRPPSALSARSNFLTTDLSRDLGLATHGISLLR